MTRKPSPPPDAELALALAPAPLDLRRIRRDLEGSPAGRHVVLREQVTSTNAALREMAEAGAADRTVLLAECQTAGRGRGDTAWFSPPRVNLYLSMLLRPRIAPSAVPVLGLAAGLAIADAVRELGLAPAIKWPNDVLVRGRKVAGTRAEAAIRGETVEYVILGVGVNLNVTDAALRQALGDAARRATSLVEALGEPVDRSAFAASLIAALDRWTGVHAADGAGPLVRAWEDLDILTGRRVQVVDAGLVIEGRVRGVDDHGRLRVEDPRGRLHAIVAGDVRLVD